jgi:hypothetical protein
LLVRGRQMLLPRRAKGGSLPVLGVNSGSFALKNRFVFAHQKVMSFVFKDFLASFPLNDIFF